MTRFEKDPEQLIEHLGMQVAYQIESAIPGGGIAGKYRVKPYEKYLDETARMIRQRSASNLTRQRATEITEANKAG